MKKSPLNWPLFITTISLIVIAAVGVLRLLNKTSTEDIKNKLTLFNSTKKIHGIQEIIEKNLAEQNKIIEEKEAPMVLESAHRYTETEIKEMTENEFVELLKTTSARLPKLSDIRKLPPSALHRTPKEILEAGQELGLIKEILSVHESYEAKVVPFYKSCAKNAEGPTPLRALCLTNLIEIKKKNGQDLNMSEYPPNIIELARMVTDL